MDSKLILEIVGYIGSAMVVVSMLMTSIVKLRIINTIGSVISGVYAVICGAIPLALMNVCLIVINVLGLVKLLKTKKDYSLVEASANEELVQFFLSYYKDDIIIYSPFFNIKDTKDQQAYLVYHEGNPVGMFLGTKKGDTFDINIEYTTPSYRDCSVGKYMYSLLPSRGIKHLTYRHGPSEGHKPYLIKMGYEFNNGIYEKSFN